MQIFETELGLYLGVYLPIYISSIIDLWLNDLYAKSVFRLIAQHIWNAFYFIVWVQSPFVYSPGESLVPEPTYQAEEGPDQGLGQALFVHLRVTGHM